MALGIRSSGVEGAVRVAEIRHSTGLALPDCYVLDAAHQRGESVLSFGARLNVAAHEMGRRTFM